MRNRARLHAIRAEADEESLADREAVALRAHLAGDAMSVQQLAREGEAESHGSEVLFARFLRGLRAQGHVEDEVLPREQEVVVDRRVLVRGAAADLTFVELRLWRKSLLFATTSSLAF